MFLVSLLFTEPETKFLRYVFGTASLGFLLVSAMVAGLICVKTMDMLWPPPEAPPRPPPPPSHEAKIRANERAKVLAEVAKRPPATAAPVAPQKASSSISMSQEKIAEGVRLALRTLSVQAQDYFHNKTLTYADFDKWVETPTKCIEAYLQPRFAASWKAVLDKERVNGVSQLFWTAHATLEGWAGGKYGTDSRYKVVPLHLRPDLDTSTPVK